MKINGHLEFHTPSGASTDGQIKNAVIERLVGGTDGVSLPAGVAGRIAFNTTDNTYYYHSGTAWTKFATGGNAAALQTEVDNIEAALGTGLIGIDGVFNSAINNALTSVDGAGSLAEILTQMDTYFTAHDTLDELNDVTITDNSSGEILKWDGGAWVNNTLTEAGIQGLDSTLTALAALSGTGILVQTAADTFTYRTITSSTVAGDQGISIVNGNGVSANPTVGLDILGLTAEAGTPSGTDILAMYDGTNNVKVSIQQIADGIVATSSVSLGDLSDITDAITGSAVTNDKYFLNATSTTTYEVSAATLGALNNVAAAVDSATNEDILAFDGSSWTAITPATFAADISIDDISDVTVTAPTAGEILVYGSGSPAIWENKTFSEAGVMPYDADLAAIAAYDWTTNPGIMVMTTGGTVINRTIAGTGSNITVANGNGLGGNPTINLASVSQGSGTNFVKINLDSYGRVIGNTAVATSDITGLVDSTYVNVSGDTMTGNLVMATGYDITLPDAPVAATDAVNKNYVDNLVASGTVWVDPIQNPDLVGIASATPGSPLASGMYIKWGGTQGETWGAETGVVDGDMMHYTIGGWQNIGNILSATPTRLLVGVFTDAIDPSYPLPAGLKGPKLDDLAVYVGGVAGDPSNADDWDYPQGKACGCKFPITAGVGSPTDYFTMDGDYASVFKAGNELVYYTGSGSPITYTEGAHYTISSVTVTGSPAVTTIFVEEDIAGPLADGYVESPIRDGTTTLDTNELDSHFGQTYLYNQSLMEWYNIAGPGAVDAGVGLAYSGTTLNVQLGAGIKELPSDEVGLDLESGKAVQLTSEASGGLLTFVLDTNSGLDQSVNGLTIATGGITGDMFNTNVAGNGLSINSTGSPLVYSLDVNVDDSTIEISTDILQVKDSGITNLKLQNSSVTVSSDSGSDAVALGETLTVSGTDPIDTAMAANVLTISAKNATTTTKGVASFAATDFTVTSGAVSISTAGVSNTQLVNSTITFAGDTGSTAISLGGTHTIAGGTLVTATESGGTTTIDVAADLGDLTDVTITPTGSPLAVPDGEVIIQSGGTWINKPIQYVEAFTAATSWVVVHNLGQKFVNVTVYDSSDQVIIPQSITATDTTTTTITFNTVVAGTAVVMGVAGV